MFTTLWGCASLTREVSYGVHQVSAAKVTDGDRNSEVTVTGDR